MLFCFRQEGRDALEQIFLVSEGEFEGWPAELNGEQQGKAQ